MSKVFRYHQGGTDSISGWGVSAKYTDKVYGQNKDSIQDPAGAQASKEITSIPSPFARMDLIKAAFGFVNSIGLDGNTIHHKMVSHTLDVAQMFFSFDKYKGLKLLEMIKWDRNTCINELITSKNPKHQLFGRTLDLFMDQDAATYNFNQMRNIFMLRYVGPGSTKQINIIGATSPATLFFTSANDCSCVTKNIKFGTHGALDPNTDSYVKLSSRDENFIKYMYDLRASIPDFATLFSEVNAYLDKTYAELNPNLQQYINAINQNTPITTSYDELEYAMGVPVEILDFPLGKLRPIDIGATSDFAIISNRQLQKVPLALPCGAFTRKWKYTTTYWDQTISVPSSNNNALSDRTLPQDGTLWPYLTMGDFLEQNIIKLDSKAKPNDFFYGNIKDETGESHCFLLPIKKTYFDYFTIDDLKRDLHMECTKSDGVGLRVKVRLDIPVRKGKVTYECNYYVPYSDGAIFNPRDGGIISMSFTMTLFPCVKFPPNVSADYRLTLLSLDDYQMSLACYKDNNTAVNHTAVSDRNTDKNKGKIESLAPIQPMYAVQDSFDFVQLTLKNSNMVDAPSYNAIVIPKWRGNAGGTEFEFAIDFGTTNTHIEYKVDGNPSKALDISGDNIQIAYLNDDAVNDTFISTSIRNNQVPSVLGTDIKFPMRTLLSYQKDTNWNQPFWPYITGNMPFYYGSVDKNKFNNLESDLKWSSPTEMIKCYLSSIMMLLRNKVLMEGGDLASTHIVWFYPISMSINRLGDISNIWAELYQTYFGPDVANRLVSIPESIAPYTYYAGRFGGGLNVLTIDIGGGTTDAYIVDNNAKPAFITSFRFAANSLFGDAFKKEGADSNGFVQKFKPLMKGVVDANQLGIVTRVLDDVENTKVSSDYISLLFTLKDNSDVVTKGCQDNVDFMKMLKNENGAKTLMLIFYSAIIYYMATFIKAMSKNNTNIREPQYLAFSGNGSKLLNILGVDSNIGQQMLSRYTKRMFEKIFERAYPDYGLTVVTDSERPKEATSKGGLALKNIPDPMRIKDMSATLLGTSDLRCIQNGEQYCQLTDQDWNGVNEEIADFTDKFFDLAKEIDIKNAFGALPYADIVKYKHMFTANVQNKIRNALNFYGKLNAESPIEDTLFFYPITQLLNELAPKIL